MKHLTLFIVALLFINSSLKAQEKKTLYQVEANALINDNDAVYKSGVGFTAGAYWPLSPSFNLGPAVSADFLGIRNTSASYRPVSVRLAVIWFPEKLLNNILPTPVWSAFYFKTGLGHAFNYSPLTDQDALNSASFNLGLMFPAKARAVSLNVGIATYGVKKDRGFVQGNSGVLTTVGVSYNIFKYKQQVATQ